MAMRLLRQTFAFARAAFAGAFVLALAAGCSSTTAPTPPPLPPVSAVVLSIDADTLQVGTQQNYSVTVYDTLGAVIAGAGASWSTSDPNVFTVNSSGRVTAQGEGVAKLFAEAGGVSDSATIAVFVQAGWYVQTSGTTNNLNGVHVLPDGRTGWAVGDAGTIVKTSDAGVSWAAQASNTAFSLNGVWFTSATDGWAVGNNGTVVHTTNGGTLWTRLMNTGTAATLNDVYFATRDTGWAVGSNGTIIRTFDRGASWQAENPTAFQLYGVAFSSTRDGWAVGDNGTIVGTHDRGLSWYVVSPSVTAQSLRGVSRTSMTSAWAAGQQGTVPATVATPDSADWQLRTVGAANQLEGNSFPTSMIGYAVGFNGSGIILKSVDGGVTYGPQTSNSAQRLNDVWFVDALRGWAVGEGGRIVHTSRGGD